MESSNYIVSFFNFLGPAMEYRGLSQLFQSTVPVCACLPPYVDVPECAPEVPQQSTIYFVLKIHIAMVSRFILYRQINVTLNSQIKFVLIFLL